jgi:hypothetical protein
VNVSTKTHEVSLPFKGMGDGGTTFMALERRPASRGFAPIDASRGDDERVFDSLHRAGIDIKLVGNPTNGFSSL